MGVGGVGDAAVCGGVDVRALWWVLALGLVLLCGLGCRGENKADSEAAQAITSPELKPWGVPIADAPGLLSGIVNAVAVEPGGALWFGTSAGGASRYDPSSGAWKTFTEKDGLAYNAVRAIAVEPGGALWF